MYVRDEFSVACIASQCLHCSHQSLNIYLQWAFPHFSHEWCWVDLFLTLYFRTVPHYSNVLNVHDVGRFVASMFSQASAWWVSCWTCRFQMNNVIKFSAPTDMRYERVTSGSDSVQYTQPTDSDSWNETFANDNITAQPSCLRLGNKKNNLGMIFASWNEVFGGVLAKLEAKWFIAFAIFQH